MYIFIFNSIFYSFFSKFSKFFKCLPYASVLEDQIFVTHGGIGPNTYKMKIEEMNKFPVKGEDLSYDHPFFELLWSDPSDKLKDKLFGSNQRGGNTKVFSKEVTETFLNNNNLNYLIR